jgi:putative transposase
VARKPRQNLAGGVYHVYARGNVRAVVYRDDADRLHYLRLLANVVTAKRWQCLAYCLMDNHVHLILETPDANLSSGMQRLHGSYSQAFNARHGRSGHVFQGRYGAALISSTTRLCATAAYIARNPVAAGLCERAEGWPWSSYGAALNGSGPAWLASERLLSFFGEDRLTACRCYAELAYLNGV